MASITKVNCWNQYSVIKCVAGAEPCVPHQTSATICIRWHTYHIPCHTYIQTCLINRWCLIWPDILWRPILWVLPFSEGSNTGRLMSLYHQCALSKTRNNIASEVNYSSTYASEHLHRILHGPLECPTSQTNILRSSNYESETMQIPCNRPAHDFYTLASVMNQ